MRFLPVSTNAMLVELADLDATLMLFEALKRAPMEGIEEVVPAARTLLIRFRPEIVTAEALARHLAGLDLTHVSRGHGQLIEIPVAATTARICQRSRNCSASRRKRSSAATPGPNTLLHSPASRRLRLHGRAGSGPRGPTSQNAAHAHSGGGRGACWAIQRYLPPRESRRVADHRHDAACHVRPRPRAPRVAATR